MQNSFSGPLFHVEPIECRNRICTFGNLEYKKILAQLLRVTYLGFSLASRNVRALIITAVMLKKGFTSNSLQNLKFQNLNF